MRDFRVIKGGRPMRVEVAPADKIDPRLASFLVDDDAFVFPDARAAVGDEASDAQEDTNA